MKHDVFRLTDDALSALENIAEESPEIYLNQSTDFGALLRERGIAEYAELMEGVGTERPISLTPVESGPQNTSDLQALDYHANLAGVTPATAMDVNFQAWVCHFRIHAYCIERWDVRSSKNPRRSVKLHWFRGDGDFQFRAWNTAARTWWIAHTARKAVADSGGAFDERQALEQYAGRGNASK